VSDYKAFLAGCAGRITLLHGCAAIISHAHAYMANLSAHRVALQTQMPFAREAL
jgi:hypothetical protein